MQRVQHHRRPGARPGARASAQSRTRAPAQSGAVLILGLVVLLVITLLGITGMNTTVMQERMAGNLRQNNLALQAAEAALQGGLAYIEDQTLPPLADSSGTHHVWSSCTVADLTSEDCDRLETVVNNWKGELPANVDGGVDADDKPIAPAVNYGHRYQVVVAGAGDLPGVYAQPRIYIEERYVPPLDVDQAAQGVGVHYYTVTAVGFGGSDSARAIVQSTVAKVYQY